MLDDISKSPVIPIPVPFDKRQNIDDKAVERYLRYLEGHGARTIMTTAGTSQFNLLEDDEILRLNILCSTFKGDKILGIAPCNTRHAIKQTKELNAAVKNCVGKAYLLAMYPDRYYAPENIVEHFHEIADASNIPVFVHGMFMRRATGGTYDFSSTLIEQIGKHDNIVGMKEETSDIGKAYGILKDISDDFVRIVAGSSMRRYKFIGGHHKTTFLAGIGNFYPELEQRFLDLMRRAEDPDNEDPKCYTEAMRILEVEDDVFSTFMKFGWHLSLRTALKIEGMPYHNTYDRKPFVQPSKSQSQSIKLAADNMNILAESIIRDIKEGQDAE